MDVWFSSDHHFWHKNVILYCKRPFASAEEFESKNILENSVIKMNEEMIARWNAKVKPTDKVIYAGDFSLASRAVVTIVPRLNGHITLVAGNHDHVHPVHYKKESRGVEKRKLYYEAGIKDIALDLDMDIGTTSVKVHHMPYIPENPPEGYDLRHKDWRPKDDGRWLIHGHVHEKWKVNGRMINVGVDVWDFTPVHIDEIAAIINKGKS